jgi:hypothetical protein
VLPGRCGEAIHLRIRWLDVEGDGIVHEHGERAEAIDCRADEPLTGGLIGEIGGQKDGLSGQPPKPLDDPGAALGPRKRPSSRVGAQLSERLVSALRKQG